MKVLVIPDIHLKPNMFRMAHELMKDNIADKAVCLMDIADDWNQQGNLKLYKETYNEAIRFAKDHPQTLWCYGNHDLSYVWKRIESGFSTKAADIVEKKISELTKSLANNNSINYIHKIDNVLFSHGGVCDYFVRKHVPASKYNDAQYVVDTINGLGNKDMWTNESPIWLRPQQLYVKMYKPRKLLQVVGHTPVGRITKEKNLISCDVFSTDRFGLSLGSEKFLLLDTLTWEYQEIKGSLFNYAIDLFSDDYMEDGRN